MYVVGIFDEVSLIVLHGAYKTLEEAKKAYERVIPTIHENEYLGIAVYDIIDFIEDMED